LYIINSESRKGFQRFERDAPEETLEPGLEEGGRRSRMAVVAKPQKINGLVLENQVETSKVKAVKSQSLLERFISFLYPAWAVQMSEDLYERYSKVQSKIQSDW